MKPSIPKGTRDFLPKQMAGRNFIFDTAKSVFKKFGFEQIETPAVENLATLTGKYGDEGDQLMFKILNRGDKFKKAVSNDQLTKESDFAELALRYDLTVPFARFVVQNQNDISFPFKRFQIQPVWRADRPQKGRYREFFQCDVDVVGTDSLLCEVELIQIYDEVLTKLNIPDFKIRLNNRKILAGIAEVSGAADKIVDITVAIDKLDKIGLEKVKEEMADKGVPANAIEKIQPIIELSGSATDQLETLSKVLSDSEQGMTGIEELKFIINSCADLGSDSNLVFDVTLARGLGYYTGAIFEVESSVFRGSIGGGGRYDDLTGIFGLKDVSGVGVSFGADRIYDIMLDNDLFPKEQLDATKVMFVNFGEQEASYCLKILKKLRDANVNSELYPSSAKMKKQMTYADNKQIPFVAMVGSNELENNTVTLKNMETGNQEELNFDDLLKALS